MVSAQPGVNRFCQQFRISEGVGDAISQIGVFVVARVAHQCPAWAIGLAEEIRHIPCAYKSLFALALADALAKLRSQIKRLQKVAFHVCAKRLKLGTGPFHADAHHCPCGIGPIQRDLYSAFLAAYLDPADPSPSCAQSRYAVGWEGREPGLRAAYELAYQRASARPPAPRSFGIPGERVRLPKSPNRATQEPLSLPGGKAGNVEAKQGTSRALARRGLRSCSSSCRLEFLPCMVRASGSACVASSGWFFKLKTSRFLSCKRDFHQAWSGLVRFPCAQFLGRFSS